MIERVSQLFFRSIEILESLPSAARCLSALKMSPASLINISVLKACSPIADIFHSAFWASQVINAASLLNKGVALEVCLDCYELPPCDAEVVTDVAKTLNPSLPR